ncbi:hypothetical protein NBRC116493_28590 [Aurantivibrio infirmus]
MQKIITNFIKLICLFSISIQVFSQNANCPSSNRIIMAPQGSTGNLDFSDGAYKLFLGAGDIRGSQEKTLTSVVFRNGECLGGYFAFTVDGKSGRNGLQENANLCLGDKDDQVQVLTKTTTFSCGNGKISLYPFIYNGYRLAIYGGGGNDLIKGGNGRDKIHGGSGVDWIDANKGDLNYSFGESGSDVVVGSTGNRSLTNGGSGNDVIRDLKGNNDFLIGGAGADNISSGCSTARIICGPSGNENDTARSLTRPVNSANCQNWVKTQCK